MKIDKNDPRTIPKGVKRIKKYGIEICNRHWPCYGGHTHWLCDAIAVDYIVIYLVWSKFRYGYYWYDGQHHELSLGIISVCWGGRPYKDV